MSDPQIRPKVRAAEFESVWRLINGRATEEEEEELWAMLPDPPEFDGLPQSTGFILLAMRKWPWDERTGSAVRKELAKWTPEQKRLFEERFADSFDGGVH